MPEDICNIPLNYPASHIYVDESGTITGANRFFVVAAVKVRRHGEFQRSIRSLRERHDFHGEFRFNQVTRAKLPLFFDLVDVTARADVTWAACIVDATVARPSDRWANRWEAQAQVTAQLLRGCINRRELTSLALDHVSTPAEVAYEDSVRHLVNHSHRRMTIVTAMSLDSRSCDGLQVADVIAGAVALDARFRFGVGGTANSNKAKVVERLRNAFNLSEIPGRTRRTNVATYRGPGQGGQGRPAADGRSS